MLTISFKAKEVNRTICRDFVLILIVLFVFFLLVTTFANAEEESNIYRCDGASGIGYEGTMADEYPYQNSCGCCPPEPWDVKLHLDEEFGQNDYCNIKENNGKFVETKAHIDGEYGIHFGMCQQNYHISIRDASERQEELFIETKRSVDSINDKIEKLSQNESVIDSSSKRRYKR